MRQSSVKWYQIYIQKLLNLIWDIYRNVSKPVLYNLNVHCATGRRPFDIVSSTPGVHLPLRGGCSYTNLKRPYQFAEQLQRAIPKHRTFLDDAQRRSKADFDKRPRKACRRPIVDGWIFMDTSDAISKPSGNDKCKLTHLTEGQCKLLDLSSRTAVIQRRPLVERIAVDHITRTCTRLWTTKTPVCYQYPPVFPQKIGIEVWMIDGLLKRSRKKKARLSSWCNGHATLNLLGNSASKSPNSLFHITSTAHRILILMMQPMRELKKIALRFRLTRRSPQPHRHIHASPPSPFLVLSLFILIPTLLSSLSVVYIFARRRRFSITSRSHPSPNSPASLC